MKRILLLAFSLPLFNFAQSGIGIGTNIPEATLDIREADPSNPTAAAGIAIPQVAVLPSSGNRSGQVVLLTTDNKLYYYNGANWGLISSVQDLSAYLTSANAATTYEPLKGTNDNFVTDAEKTLLSNTSGTNTGDQDLSAYLTAATATTTYEPLKGTDDNFVTDAEKTLLSNTSGTNTGDQDLSAYLTAATATITYEPIKGTDDNFVTNAEKTLLSNTSGTNTGDQDISGIDTNSSNISTNTAAIALNTAKVTNATHTGDVTGATALTIGDGKVTDAKIADVAATKITGTVAITKGGTGTSTTPTQYGVIYANSTSEYASTGAGTSGQILVSNGTSAPSWQNSVAIKSPVIASLSTVSKIITNTSGEYTGSSITLPSGKWSVQINMLLPATGDGEFWLRSLFSDSSTNSTMSSDIVGGGLAGGFQPEGKLNMLNGTIIINNTSGANKTYYYWTGAITTYSGTFQISNFGTGLPGENQMIAYPMNN